MAFVFILQKMKSVTKSNLDFGVYLVPIKYMKPTPTGKILLSICISWQMLCWVKWTCKILQNNMPSKVGQKKWGKIKFY